MPISWCMSVHRQLRHQLVKHREPPLELAPRAKRPVRPVRIASPAAPKGPAIRLASLVEEDDVG